MTHFAATRAADRAALAHRVRREVIVEHELLGRLFEEPFDPLLVANGSQSDGHQRLRFAAGEESRPVHARNDLDGARNGAKISRAPSVGTLAFERQVAWCRQPSPFTARLLERTRLWLLADAEAAAELAAIAADPLAAAPAEAPSPERLVFSGQVQRRVESAMARLSERERAAFVLRHFEQLSTKEIGTTLGLDEGAVKHSVFRAVRKLREALEPFVAARPRAEAR